MVGAEYLLIDLQGPHEQRLGERISFGHLVEVCEIIQARCKIAMCRPECPLTDRDGSLVERLRLGEIAQFLAGDGKIVS